MTNILTFTPPGAAARARPRPEKPATIIIFPGVRYERVAAPPERARPAARRRGARKGAAEPG